MIEKEQIYVDFLRSQIASSPDEKKYSELAKTEKNLQTLQDMLLRSQSEVNMFKSVFFCVVSEWLIRIMYKYVYYSEADLILYVWRLFLFYCINTYLVVDMKLYYILYKV